METGSVRHIGHLDLDPLEVIESLVLICLRVSHEVEVATPNTDSTLLSCSLGFLHLRVENRGLGVVSL